LLGEESLRIPKVHFKIIGFFAPGARLAPESSGVLALADFVEMLGWPGLAAPDSHWFLDAFHFTPSMLGFLLSDG
jgi:hypothetical protein